MSFKKKRDIQYDTLEDIKTESIFDEDTEDSDASEEDEEPEKGHRPKPKKEQSDRGRRKGEKTAKKKRGRHSDNDHPNKEKRRKKYRKVAGLSEDLSDNRDNRQPKNDGQRRKKKPSEEEVRGKTGSKPRAKSAFRKKKNGPRIGGRRESDESLSTTPSSKFIDSDRKPNFPQQKPAMDLAEVTAHTNMTQLSNLKDLEDSEVQPAPFRGEAFPESDRNESLLEPGQGSAAGALSAVFNLLPSPQTGPKPIRHKQDPSQNTYCHKPNLRQNSPCHKPDSAQILPARHSILAQTLPATKRKLSQILPPKNQTRAQILQLI